MSKEKETVIEVQLNKDGLEAGKLLTPKELQAHKLSQRKKPANPAKQEPKK